MKKSIGYLFSLLALPVLLLAGCGGSDSAAYTASYSMETADQITGPHLFPNETIVGMMSSQNQLFVDYQLEIEGDEYTLTSKAYTGNPDTKEAYKVGDAAGIALTVLNTAKGKVLEQTDTTIKIDKATSVTYSIPEDECDSTAKQLAEIITLAEPGSESPLGTWSSEDKPELLEAVPATTFSITEDGNITSWK